MGKRSAEEIDADILEVSEKLIVALSAQVDALTIKLALTEKKCSALEEQVDLYRRFVHSISNWYGL
jgi:hypothetical protein